MKSVTNFVITLAAVTLFAACGNSQKPAQTDPHAGHHHAPGEGHTAAVEKTAVSVSIKDDKLNAVYQHYIHLTNALINGDLAEAKVAATAIELGSKLLSNGATLTALAAKIGAAADIEVQRTAFAGLSNDFIARVKQSGLTSGEVYVEYCPMALNDKGASWLSNQKDIKNPYFGESMLTCGEVKETIK
jgi:major membrane immunogen (membrane-anchored lipoprotein)